jgi:uncharacterized LabA/DUF88 family protein
LKNKYGNVIRDVRDYDFISDNISEEVWANIMTYACTRGSFKEVCKAFREICYDQISYYDKDLHSKIYDDEEKYPREVIDCATYLQRKISTAVDLYEQCITNGRSFDWDYLNEKLGR